MSVLKPGWKMVKFGEVVKNVNLVERDPGAKGIERVMGLEHIDPENLHVRRWKSIEGAPRSPANSYQGRRFSASAGPINARLPLPSLKVFAPGISLRLSPKTKRRYCRKSCRLSARAMRSSIMRLVRQPVRCPRGPVGRR